MYPVQPSSVTSPAIPSPSRPVLSTSVSPVITVSSPEDTALEARTAKLKDLYSELALAIEWKQKSAEYRAICLQTFAIAAQALEKKIANAQEGEFVNLILDIDDNLFDCSAFFASMMDLADHMNDDRNNQWWEHGQKQASTPLPGALDFVQKYINHPKVKLTYLTSRAEHPKLKQWTTAMLKHQGFPVQGDGITQVPDAVQDTGQVIVAFGRGENGKAAHIAQLKNAPGASATLTMGDKLSDSGASMGPGIPGAKAWVENDETKAMLGHDHIVMANPLYGHWDSLTHQMKDFDPDKKSQERHDLLGEGDELDNYGTPDQRAARECRQCLHYARSANYDAYAIQLANVISDQVGNYQDNPEQAGMIAGIDGTVLSHENWRIAMSQRGRASSGQTCFNQWAARQKGKVIAGTEPLMRKLHERKIRTVYVTDRTLKVQDSDTTHSLKSSTRQELQEKGLMGKDDHLIMRETDESPLCKKARITEARTHLFADRQPKLEIMVGETMADIGIDPNTLHSDDNTTWDPATEQLGKTRFLLPNPAAPEGWRPSLYLWQQNHQEGAADGSLASRSLKAWKPTPSIPVAGHA